ncbi:helix-turn-helix domain-containing protein [Actinomadura sp. 6N118]|uniref:helix-turn-helix domain-containing protein n=1 Tax=Actinomadura sp. 6N118 TaxID=3375151 RepID=UPI00379F3B09
MLVSPSLYDAPVDQITYDMVRDFVLDAEQADLLTESLTLELKRERSGHNVVKAVQALSNADGGIVLVGVSEEHSGEDRFVGVSKREPDALVTQMRSLMPTALPEVIPVRIPNTEKLIVVLRVDADAVPHPVVVNGEIRYRVPGQNVAVDRQRIIDLVARDTAAYQDLQFEMDDRARPNIPDSFPLWAEEEPREIATLRFEGGLTLPYRALEQPWLGSAARKAVIDTLDRSPIPSKVWGLAPQQEASPLGWRISEATSTWFKLHAPMGGKVFTAGDVPVTAAAYLSLAGRELSLLLGLRYYDQSAKVVPIGLSDLYHAVLAGLLTITSVCVAVAESMDAAEPSDLRLYRGWIQPAKDYRVTSVLNLGDYPRDSTEHPPRGYFPRARSKGRTIEDLDRLTRDWITLLLLDLGLRDFEESLEDIALPAWATEFRNHP